MPPSFRSAVQLIALDSNYKASDLFVAAELPPSWQTVCAALGLNAARGLALQNALLGAYEAAVTAVQQWGRTAAARLVERRCNVHACSIRQESCAQTCPFRRGARQ